MLRIAMPNKGSLSDAARETLIEGLPSTRDSKELVFMGRATLSSFHLRPETLDLCCQGTSMLG